MPGTKEHPARRTVLVLDDDSLVRWAVRRSLERCYDVVEAADGEAALDVLASSPVDLVISDLALLDGRMDGLAFIETARRRGYPSKFLILTAFETEEVDRRAFRLGVAGVLRKPVDLPSLFEVVRSHLDNGPPAPVR